MCYGISSLKCRHNSVTCHLTKTAFNFKLCCFYSDIISSRKLCLTQETTIHVHV